MLRHELGFCTQSQMNAWFGFKSSGSVTRIMSENLKQNMLSDVTLAPFPSLLAVKVLLASKLQISKFLQLGESEDDIT